MFDVLMFSACSQLSLRNLIQVLLKYSVRTAQ